MQSRMSRRTGLVLNGFEVRSGTKRITYPDRYMGKNGKDMWERVMGLLDDPKAFNAAA
jgi:hypothetical protein